MNIRDNVRINRTKMLDEAALNHRPSHFIHTFCIFLLVYGIALLARSVLVYIATFIHMLSDEEIIRTVVEYLSKNITVEEFANKMNELSLNLPWYVWLVNIAGTGLLILAAVIYCKKFEKRSIASLGIRKTNIALEYGVGAAIGAVMYLLVVLIAYLTGSVTVALNPDVSYGLVFLFLIAFVLQGAGEEIFLRGYLMTSVARDYKVVLALIFSSAVFALLHSANTGVTLFALVNVFLFGIFEGIYILKRGDIFGACAIHTMWNFVQGNIFGSSVSGISSMPSILITTADPTMQNANGGAFGLEGGFATTIVLLVAIGILLLIPPKKSELPEYELKREEFEDGSEYQD